MIVDVVPRPLPITTPAESSPTNADPQPWDRLPDESPLWYDRFIIYCNLPPHQRSIISAYRAYIEVCRNNDVTLSTDRAPGQWYEISHSHNWRPRAIARDEYERWSTIWSDRDAITSYAREQIATTQFDFIAKARQVVNSMDVGTITVQTTRDMQALSAAIKYASQELRATIVPKQPTTQINVLAQIVAQLSDPLQRLLLNRLQSPDDPTDST